MSKTLSLPNAALRRVRTSFIARYTAMAVAESSQPWPPRFPWPVPYHMIRGFSRAICSVGTVPAAYTKARCSIR